MKEVGNKKGKIKIIITILIVVALIVVAGFLIYSFLNKKESNNDNPSNKVAELESYLKENYDKYVIDGSTSMIPLHEALEEKFGTGKEIKHTKTVSSFENFVDGKIDILLAVDYLDEYFERANAKNVEINKKEITKEALVFLKNKELEVDNLSLEQIKKIYSKEVERWNELGINLEYDNLIAPVYRNEDSGSGMALIKLLGKNNINCDEDSCVFINNMSEIVNALADGLGSYHAGTLIAYNMYTFTEKQYHNENVVPFKIDGIEPNDETIYNNEYPVILYNYIYYKNDKAKEFGEKLYEYLLTDEGQQLIMENGYVPLKKQDNVEIKDNERNCKDNFVDEVCVKREGYNESFNKFVKITIDNKNEKYEYFDTIEEYIFANSSVSKKEEQELAEFLKEYISKAKEEKFGVREIERITFETQSNGEIEVFTGGCGGTACIWLETRDDYDFGKPMKEINESYEYNYSYNILMISEDFQTVRSKNNPEEEDYFEIPLKDLLKAFDMKGGK